LLAALVRGRPAPVWTSLLLLSPFVWWLDKPSPDALLVACLAGAMLLWTTRPAVSLVLLAGGFEAASFSLLIELTRAVGRNSFDFLSESRVFGWIPGLVPDAAPSRSAVLAAVIIACIILGRIGKLAAEYLRAIYVVPRTERYRVAVGAETFRRVLAFGRQYFDRQSIGESDSEIGPGSAVIELLAPAESGRDYPFRAVRKGRRRFSKLGVAGAVFLLDGDVRADVRVFVSSLGGGCLHVALCRLVHAPG